MLTWLITSFNYVFVEFLRKVGDAGCHQELRLIKQFTVRDRLQFLSAYLLMSEGSRFMFMARFSDRDS